MNEAQWWVTVMSIPSVAVLVAGGFGFVFRWGVMMLGAMTRGS